MTTSAMMNRPPGSGSLEKNADGRRAKPMGNRVAAERRRLPGTRRKRGIDILLSVLLLVALAPGLALVALLLLIADGRPILFMHRRVGEDRRIFGCLKFRTMRRDAEERLEALLASDPALRKEWEATQKLEADPRVHPIGRFLRMSSLDELPQLFNVLAGAMSLVGPRPVTADELKRYGPHARTYLALRPGITGLWQTSGRSNTSYERRVQLDVEYYHTRSIGRDLLILLRTIRVVLFERSAC